MFCDSSGLDKVDLSVIEIGYDKGVRRKRLFYKVIENYFSS